MRFYVFTFLITMIEASKTKSEDISPTIQQTCGWQNGGCAQLCNSEQNGQIRCSCFTGFQISHRTRECQDVNECTTQEGICDHDCTNIQGSFICSCRSGFQLQPDGRSCQRKDPNHARICSSNCQHFCNSSTRTCECFNGYRLHSDGRSCIRLCSDGNGGCDHICQETSEFSFCSCRSSYVLQSDMTSCAGYTYDVMKVVQFYNKFRHRRSAVSCAVNNGGCIADCEDTPIGGQCSCAQGFVLQSDHRSCEDIDECTTDNGGCEVECRNNQGSFICSCPEGYKVASDRTSCVDINECLLNDTCQGSCTNTIGGFTCSCPSGYQLFSQVRCGDINECAVNNGGCAHYCNNLKGDYFCSCKTGFKLLWNQRDCIPNTRCHNRFKKKLYAGFAACKGKKCIFKCMIGQKFQILSPAIPTYELTCGTLLTQPPKKMSKKSSKKRKKGKVEKERRSEPPGFPWQPPTLNRNTTLPICYDNNLKLISFKMSTDSCRLLPGRIELIGDASLINFTYFALKCRALKKKKRSKPRLKLFVEMQIYLPKNCRKKCIRKVVKGRIRMIKNSIQRQQFQLRTPTGNLRVRSRSPPSERARPLASGNGCILGRTPNPGHRMCSPCNRGHFFNISSSGCSICPPKTYQDKPGQFSCENCPMKMAHFPPDPNLGPKTSVQECQGQCLPGHYSVDGLHPPNGNPCTSCPRGSYQPYKGRISCYSCPETSTTRRIGSTDFTDCIIGARCTRGHFQNGNSCRRCPKGFYQPSPSKTYCYSCPGDTSTDYDASSLLSDCKQQKCGGVIGEKSGFIESPNYPGNYPINSRCEWELRAPSKRKFLFIIPEVYLPFGDNCGDIFTMRKRKTSGSRGTGIIFNTCQTLTNPDPLPVRSRRVFIEFKSNQQNCSKGFQIPYVTYDENYDEIIQSIVKDGRLSALNHFHDILKNKRLRRTLLTVLAEPEEYFEVINQHKEELFPEDFMIFLRRKVYDAFSYPNP